MKKIIILINVFLAIILIYGVSKQFSLPTVEKPEVAEFVKKNSSNQTADNATLSNSNEELLTKIIANNIFNNANVTAITSGNNSRISFSLVGVMKMGDYSGAVILQSQSTRPSRPDDMRRGPQENSSLQTTIADYSFKQFVRLGETTSNGYVLSEVNSDFVVLSKGSERLELTLQDPSENAPKVNNNQTKDNQTATTQSNMQNAMAMQMMQNSRMMQMMQRLMQQQMRGMNNNSVSGQRGGGDGSSGGMGSGSSGGGMMGGGSSGGGRGGR